MYQATTIIILLQVSVIASIFIIGLQASNIIKEFKYLSVAWAVNLIYIFLVLLSRRYKLSVTQEVWFTGFSDLLCMYFFFMGSLSVVKERFPRLYFPHNEIILFLPFLAAGVIKLFALYTDLDYLKYIDEYSIPGAVLDMITLYCLAIFFKSKVRKFPNARVLYFGTFFYSFIQLFAIIQKNSFPEDSFVAIHLEPIAFGCGLVAKFLILTGLMLLLRHIFKETFTLESELKMKKAFTEKLNEILGRTFHEVTPPLREIENINGFLLEEHNRSGSEFRVGKKVRQKLKLIDGALLRANTILTASVRIYRSSILVFDEADSMPGLPAKVEKEAQVNNVNTLVQIAIMNFKATYFKDFAGDLYVTNRIKIRTEYAANCDLECNPVEMVQIFYNLLKNSYEAFGNTTHSCQIYIRTKNVDVLAPDYGTDIEENEEQDDESDEPAERKAESGRKKFILVEIEDNGPGIPGGLQDRIFELGFSTKSEDKAIRGFGLDVVKSYTELNKGVVSVESPVIKSRIVGNKTGTKFKFLFPK